MNETKFELCKGNSEGEFSFFQMPKALTEGSLSKLSIHAKYLYMLLYDRLRLSLMNEWRDENGDIYIYYTIEEIASDMNICKKTASKLLSELEGGGSHALIRRKKQGLCKPDRIYVYVIAQSREEDIPLRESKKESPGDENNSPQEPKKLHTNKNNIIKNKNIKNDLSNKSILSYHSDKTSEGYDKRDTYREQIYKNIDYDIITDSAISTEPIDAIVDIMLDMLCTERGYVEISSENIPIGEVERRLLSLRSDHIEYILEALKKVPSKIHNIKKYISVCLYNAPLTIDCYYTNEARNG